MSRQIKTTHMTFRVTAELMEEIDKAVVDYRFKDRTELGTEAILHFLKFKRGQLTNDNEFLLCDKGHIVKYPIGSTEGLLCPIHLIDSKLESHEAIDILNWILDKVKR